MITLEDIEKYWSKYALGLESLAKGDNFTGIYQQIKQNHDKAYTFANSLLDLPSLKGKSVLELACGIGLDTLELARHGANVTAIDVSRTCIDVAKEALNYQNLDVDFLVANAEELCFPDNSFDIIIARGILMYTVHPDKIIYEINRMLKLNGKAFLLLHNKYSWYVFLAKISMRNLYNDKRDPPINRLYSLRETKELFRGFSSIKLFLDRLPSKTANRNGVIAGIYNNIFVPSCKLIPKSIMKLAGFYIIAEVTKGSYVEYCPPVWPIVSRRIKPQIRPD